MSPVFMSPVDDDADFEIVKPGEETLIPDEDDREVEEDEDEDDSDDDDSEDEDDEEDDED